MGKNVVVVAFILSSLAVPSTNGGRGLDGVEMKVVPRLMTTPTALVFFTLGERGLAPEDVWNVEMKTGRTWKRLGRTAGTFLLRDSSGTGRGPSLYDPLNLYGELTPFEPGDAVPILFDTRGLKQGKIYRLWNRDGVEFTATFPKLSHPIKLDYTVPPLICQRRTDVFPKGVVVAARIDLDKPLSWQRVDGRRCSDLAPGTYQVRSAGGFTRYFTSSLMK